MSKSHFICFMTTADPDASIKVILVNHIKISPIFRWTLAAVTSNFKF